MNNFVERFRPKATKGNETFDAIYKTDAEEIEKADKLIFQVMKNNFVISADMNGIKNYEKIYKIKPDSGSTIEERRKVILDKILYKPPFTRQRFKEILDNLWGQGNYTFEIDYNNYMVMLDVDTDDPEYYLKFQKQVRKIIPSNMYLGFAIQYTYLYLRKEFTYGQLNDSGLTYFDLSQYSYRNVPYTNYYLYMNMTHEQMMALTHAELHR